MNIVTLENTVSKVVITCMDGLVNDENDVVPIEVSISTKIS